MSVCPSCLLDDALYDHNRSACSRCGAQMAVDGRFRLDAFLGGERSHDVVDAIGPLLLGTDLTDNTAVLLRLAADNDASRSRLLREAVISAGLSHPQ